MWGIEKLIVGPFTSIAEANAWAAANPGSLFVGLRATVNGTDYTWRGAGVGWGEVNSGYLHAWTGFGDSITATGFSFSLSAIQSLGMRPVGISAGDYGVQLFGYPGKRSDEVLQYLPLVIASGAKNCIVMIGTNDCGQDASLSAFYTNIVNIYTTLKSAEIRVIGCHIPPGTATPANVFKFNHAISKAGESCGVQILSPWDAFANATTGALVSGIDATHPTPAQSASASVICVQQIKDNLTSKILTNSNVGGWVSNGCFAVDSNADGRADSWNSYGSGITFSLVAGQNGNKQRLTSNIASGNSGMYQDLSAPIAGNKIKLTGKIRITSPSNVAVSVYIRFKNSGGTGIRDAFLFARQEASDIDLYGDIEVVVPAGTASAQISCEIDKGGAPAVYPAVAIVDFERIQALDMTAAGIG